MFMNKWLKHAYYPIGICACLCRHGRYEQIVSQPTASGDNEVHERLIAKGRTELLKCEMEHYAFPSVDL